MPFPNPFFHRGPVRDRVYFFGREPETRQVLSLLSNGQSISLVGQRRRGRTQLQLAAPFRAPVPIQVEQHVDSPIELQLFLRSEVVMQAEEAARAHERLAEGHVLGKVVLGVR